MTIPKICIECNKEIFIENISPVQYELIKENKELIQNILPKHSKEEREMFISGICGECWLKLFPIEMEEL